MTTAQFNRAIPARRTMSAIDAMKQYQELASNDKFVKQRYQDTAKLIWQTHAFPNEVALAVNKGVRPEESPSLLRPSPQLAQLRRNTSTASAKWYSAESAQKAQAVSDTVQRPTDSSNSSPTIVTLRL